MGEPAAPEPPRIHVLPEQVSRKIAAGEVIDRPYSVIRELLDNALDADASHIEVHLEEGGSKAVRVTDDGAGMTKADLELCYLPHATSKIANERDLEAVGSLGFRGEALSSIATVARLRITSAPDDSGSGHRLVADGGSLVSLAPAPANRGTTVEVSDLFFSFPARRRFLKRASAETTMSQTVLLDKAVAFPGVGFRLFTDGKMKVFLPPDDPAGRILGAYPDLGDRRLLHTIDGEGPGLRFTVITPGLEMVRRDRKRIQVFVNRRRVWEYALVQAVEHAFSDYLPGGLFPNAFVFIEVDPGKVDFNIHPAKREVRLRNIREIHAQLVRRVKEYLGAEHGGSSRRGQLPVTEPELETARPPSSPWSVADSPPSHEPPSHEPDKRSGTPGSGRADAGQAAPAAFDLTRKFDVPRPDTPSVRYLGQAMGLFLVGESEHGVYLVDQHAGHERVLYERLRSSPRVQHLLVPTTFETTAWEDELLTEHRQDLATAGVVLERVHAGSWRLTGIPAVEGLDAQRLCESLRELSAAAEIERDLFADLACKAALKDGDVVDEETGRRLMGEIFALETPHCPHGRPLWLELSREQLLHLIGRTL
ncbi:MAG: DNA mismatch repair endonuclease MutL [Spirochaetaceae bacterium]